MSFFGEHGIAQRWVRSYVLSCIRKLGLDLVLYDKSLGLTTEERDIVFSVQPYTMTNVHRLAGLVDAIKYLVSAGVPGDVVECGVWRGGSAMAAAKTLILHEGVPERDLYLFDTFEGMSRPGKQDVARTGKSAEKVFNRNRTGVDSSAWCVASLDDVRASVLATGYDPARCHFVVGKVEDTLPRYAPQSIALMRLDTDWYESTKHELIHLFPRLSPGGVLIVDDYGYWQGARQAVDEYFTSHGIDVLLHRMDHSARMLVKPHVFPQHLTLTD